MEIEAADSLNLTQHSTLVYFAVMETLMFFFYFPFKLL